MLLLRSHRFLLPRCLAYSAFVSSYKSALGSPLRRPRSMATYGTSVSPSPSRFLLRQLFEKESSTYTYLLADLAHPYKPAVVSAALWSLSFSVFRFSDRRLGLLLRSLMHLSSENWLKIWVLAFPDIYHLLISYPLSVSYFLWVY